MQKLEVFGANKLKGQIKISGSKNASLPILAATLLSNKKVYSLFIFISSETKIVFTLTAFGLLSLTKTDGNQT